MVFGTVAAVIIVAIPLAARSCEQARDTAVEATQEFRTRIGSRAYDTIVGAAAPEFQKSAAEGDFAKAMDAIRERLGLWQSSETPTSQVFASTSGPTVTLVYMSHFERGTATEEFVWRIRGGKPALAGYRVKSSALAAR